MSSQDLLQKTYQETIRENKELKQEKEDLIKWLEEGLFLLKSNRIPLDNFELGQKSVYEEGLSKLKESNIK